MKESKKIYAYKHSGSFHRFWEETEIIYETKDYCVTYTPKGKLVKENSGYKWRTKEPAICYFSKKHWFNIIIMYKKKEITYYCNLATPIITELDALKYIDYDLDVKYFVNSKKIKVLDKNEYIENKKKYEYPNWIDAKINEEIKILKFWMKNEIGPFSNEFRKRIETNYVEELCGSVNN